MAPVDGSSSPGESSCPLLPGECALGLQVIALSLGFPYLQDQKTTTKNPEKWNTYAICLMDFMKVQLGTMRKTFCKFKVVSSQWDSTLDTQ